MHDRRFEVDSFILSPQGLVEPTMPIKTDCLKRPCKCNYLYLLKTSLHQKVDVYKTFYLSFLIVIFVTVSNILSENPSLSLVRIESLNRMKNNMTNNYNFYENAPANFDLCLKSECKSANECLRGLAARDLKDDRLSIMVLNPLLTNAAGKNLCSHFCKAERVRIAYGFNRAINMLPSGKVNSVRSAICAYVSLRTYYYLLRGEKPIDSEMQKVISTILINHGAETPFEFDRYEWEYIW